VAAGDRLHVGAGKKAIVANKEASKIGGGGMNRMTT
jgi:hypothetical protein